jgi:hypothetical protein
MTNVQVQGNSVHDYKTAGIVANESGTMANLMNNSVQGLGSAASIPQTGISVGFGAQGNINQNVVSNNTGPGPYCTVTPTSTNIASQQTPPGSNNSNVQIQNNVSSLAETGIGDVNSQVHIQNNFISESFCAGIYVQDNNNNVGNNVVNETCNPQLSSCSSYSPSSTPPPQAIEVVSGNNNNVNNNTINEAVFGVVSDNAASNTQANGESIYNTLFPFAGMTYQNYSLKPPPHAGGPFMPR